MELRTCRFCGMSNYEHKHPAAKSVWIKYGLRHSAHLKCLIERKGEAAIRALPTHILEGLPVFELRDLGRMDIVLVDELLKRGRITEDQAKRWRLV